jgi:hypothetical protein
VSGSGRLSDVPDNRAVAMQGDGKRIAVLAKHGFKKMSP